MEESMLKTSLKQRLIIGLVAVALLASSLAVYVAIILNGGSDSLASTSESELTAILSEYKAKEAEISTELSSVYFDTLNAYRSEIKAFNATAANEGGVKTRDLSAGTGAEITEENRNYYAYYIGWCANESVFDSSFNDNDNPTSLNAPLEVANLSLIEGWNTGMNGAKIGGVRELTIPGELAYGEQTEICGGYNSPLKFIVMTIDPEANASAKAKFAELDEIYQRYIAAYAAYSSSQQSTAIDTDSDSSADDSGSGVSESSKASEEAGE